MESITTLDPYEQQLLTVFDAYDHDNMGSLDRDGLTQLCHTLQLDEQANDLIRFLLKDDNRHHHPDKDKLRYSIGGSGRATFDEFKDALLNLLANMQQQQQQNLTKNNNNCKQTEQETTPTKKMTTATTENGSPDREVSPKFVYGSKKYGRRSRPRSDEFTTSTTTDETSLDEDDDLNLINNRTNQSVSVQRSNSQSEVVSNANKKRKTQQQYKLKRCTSLPGNQRYNHADHYHNHHHTSSSFITSSPVLLSPEQEFVCTEEMLREAWRKLGVGEDGYLNQTELVLVCDAIGLDRLAKSVIRQLSDKLSLDFDHRISFQELLEVLQQDETWSEVLSSTATTAPSSVDNTNPITADNDLTLTLSSNVNNTGNSTSNATSTTTTSADLFPDSRTFQYVTLGPDGNGIITADTVIEMWESVGITSPKELIHELGFNSREISVVELAAVLEKEIKGISDSSNIDIQQNPHVALLQANLTLYQSEIRCLKLILEQMHAERDKLKSDIAEANNRATLLAQEVDDNHTRMELNTLNQVKLLEHRHSDILKDLQRQFAQDKDQLHSVNRALEVKIVSLEQEVGKLKSDMLVAQKYSNGLEKENQTLSGRISELQQVKEMLTNQISGLEAEKQKYVEMEQEQLEPLLAKLSSLQVENAQLRDRNDEMVAEIETLTNQVGSMRTKVMNTPTYLGGGTGNTLDQSMGEEEGSFCAVTSSCNEANGVGYLGAKRRSDYSPTKDDALFALTDGSPRLGKVRKFHTKTLTSPSSDPSSHLEVTTEHQQTSFTAESGTASASISNESGFEPENDACLDNNNSSSYDTMTTKHFNNKDGTTIVVGNEELTRLRSKIAFLEQVLVSHNIPVPVQQNDTEQQDVDLPSSLSSPQQIPETTVAQLKRRVQELEQVFENLGEVSKMITKNGLNMENIKIVSDKLESILAKASAGTSMLTKEMSNAETETDCGDLKDFEEIVGRYEKENKDLTTKCEELENCIELLRNEYEKCEDYWQMKLEEERQIFEQEQNQSSEKLSDLIQKMAEYEEQFAAQDVVDSRLPTIDETYNLEKQFTDLEQEFEDYRSQCEREMFKKDEEILLLKQKLTELALSRQQQQQKEMGVQAQILSDEEEQLRINDKMSSLTLCMVESTNLFSSDAMPQKVDYFGPQFVWNRDSSQGVDTRSEGGNSSLSWQNGASSSSTSANQTHTASTSACSTLEKNISSSSALQQPSYCAAATTTATLATNSNNNTASAPCRPKRTRKHQQDRNTLLYNRNKNVSSSSLHGVANDHGSTEGRDKELNKTKTEEQKHSQGYQHNPQRNDQVVTLPVSAVHNLNGRLYHLEQRCRQLQLVLKQQHFYTEQALAQTRQIHRGEKAELQCMLRGHQEKLDQQIRICNDQLERLARSDMLVKELYVENSYLIAKVQRLEQQCHMLVQCNSNSCSV